MIGAHFLVPFDFDFGHDFEAGLEMQPFAVMRVQVRHPGLRNRHQAEPLRFLAEILGNERVNNVILYVLRKPLTNDGGRHMTAAKSGNASELLVFLDQSVGFAGDFFGGNFDFDLSLRACGGFSWTHYLPFGKSSLVAGRNRVAAYQARLSAKLRLSFAAHNELR